MAILGATKSILSAWGGKEGKERRGAAWLQRSPWSISKCFLFPVRITQSRVIQMTQCEADTYFLADLPQFKSGFNSDDNPNTSDTINNNSYIQDTH